MSARTISLAGTASYLPEKIVDNDFFGDEDTPRAAMFRGAKAPDNPWGAKGLEWQTTSPPPEGNFLTPPVVPERQYDYPMPDGLT